MKNRQKLLVIGNGMAGARAVEEILARGGADPSKAQRELGWTAHIKMSDVVQKMIEAGR